MEWRKIVLTVKRLRTNPIIASFGAIGLLWSLSAINASAAPEPSRIAWSWVAVPGGTSDCKVVNDAGDKNIVTNHHAWFTQTGAGSTGKPISGESITVNGTRYTLSLGKWRQSLISVKDELEQAEENRKEAKDVSCQYLRDEAAGGESAQVYSYHANHDGAIADITLWISKSSHLLLREEIDIALEAHSKMHTSERFEYTNVHAPQI
jgi:hypothetical protein